MNPLKKLIKSIDRRCLGSIFEKTQQNQKLNESLHKLLLKCYKPIVDYVYLYYYETSGANYWFYDCNDKSFNKVKNDEFVKEVINKIDYTRIRYSYILIFLASEQS